MLARAQKLVKEEPSLVYVSIAPRGNSTRLICFVGPKAREAGVAADALVKELAKAAGGSGGGTKEFAQGGGPKTVELERREGPPDQSDHRDHREVERRHWRNTRSTGSRYGMKSGIFESEAVPGRKKAFVTFPFPYMNGPLHIGHCFTATRVDIYARFKRMQGYNVLFPWAWHWTGESIPGMSYRLSLGRRRACARPSSRSTASRRRRWSGSSTQSTSRPTTQG